LRDYCRVLTKEVNIRTDMYVIITVILKVLQLFVVATSEDPINRFTNQTRAVVSVTRDNTIRELGRED
jgi:hypothetical protein